MTEEAKALRLQSTLSIAGSGVIAFCVWSIAKTCLFLAFADEGALRSLLDINDASLIPAIYLSLGAIIVVDACLRVFVGLSARAEGRGKRKGPVYVVVAAIIALVNAFSLVGIALGTSFALSSLSMVVSVAVEATSVAALVLVIYSSISLRRMGKAMG